MSATCFWFYSGGRMAEDESGGAPAREKGGADHDKPYEFGRPICATFHWLFTDMQYARLLVLRGRVRDLLYGEGDTEAAED